MNRGVDGRLLRDLLAIILQSMESLRGQDCLRVSMAILLARVLPLSEGVDLVHGVPNIVYLRGWVVYQSPLLVHI